MASSRIRGTSGSEFRFAIVIGLDTMGVDVSVLYVFSNAIA